MRDKVSNPVYARAITMSLSVAVVLIFAVRSVPHAQADGSGSFPKCVAVASPCGDPCPNDDNYQCGVDLNGWEWGDCDPTQSSKKKCHEHVSGPPACGVAVDCDTGNPVEQNCPATDQKLCVNQ